MASVNDTFTKTKDLFSTTLSSGVDDSTGTIPLNSTSGLPTDTAVILTIDAVDSQGTDTPTLREVVKGIISGSNLTSTTRGVEGTAQAHSSGAVVTMVPTAKLFNDYNSGFTAEHNNVGGTHKIPVNYDSNGNENLELGTTASAVNHVKILNAASGNNAQISAQGTGAGSNRAIDIIDSNGNELLKGSATASAVNEVTLANAATGTGPTVSATGDNTNIDLNLTPKGTGNAVATNLKSKGLFVNRVAKTNSDSPYSIATTDDFVSVDATSGATTVTLPTAASITGRIIKVAKTDSSANVVTVATTSAQTINGSSNDYLSNQYDFVEYMSDGSNWIISRERRNSLLSLATRTSSFATTASSATQITDMAVTPYVPAGGRRVQISLLGTAQTVVSGGIGTVNLHIFDGAVGGTDVATTQVRTDTASYMKTETIPLSLAAGNAKTFRGAIDTSAGTITLSADANRPIKMEARLVG